jgi:hypothetical protein
MDTLDFVPQRLGSLYGTAVHFAFAAAIRFQDIPGIGIAGVEQSFQFGEMSRYGVEGSMRTDVVLRNDIGAVVAIYDVKTGGARLRPSRAAQLRAAVGVGPGVPVIELHFERGATLKYESIRENFWTHESPSPKFGALQGYARGCSDRAHPSRFPS